MSTVEKLNRLLGSHRESPWTFETPIFFRRTFEIEALWNHSGPLLVLGNPPWVTNSELGSLASNNTPKKTNLRKLQGIAALTGQSNFDLGEALWIKLLTELEAEHPTIALLCKMAVARNVLRFLTEQSMPISKAEIRRIDAKKWFAAAVEACLFIVHMGPGPKEIKAAVYSDLLSYAPEVVLDGSTFCDSPVPRVKEAADKTSLDLSWRQGIKHDAVNVMELTEDPPGRWRNKAGILVEVEPEYVYPLLKSSDLFNGRETRPRRHVIVTQKRIGENTDCLRGTAPMLWGYLRRNSEAFAKRKSSVFKRQSSFAMFGVGDYSFADHKVAVAGLYSEPRFRVLKPIRGKPVMLDDTCYFAGCQSADHASFVADLLNSRSCLNLLKPLVFPGSKRPITKSILQRIDLLELLEASGRKEDCS